MDDGELNEKLLGVTINEFVRLVVPFAAFEEESINVASRGRSFFDVIWHDVVTNDMIISNSVDGNLVLSGIILESTSQESLGEEESREPELDRSTYFNPFVKEVNSVVSVQNPRSKGLERQETNFVPRVRRLIVEHRSGDCFELISHNNFSDKSSLNHEQVDLHLSK